MKKEYDFSKGKRGAVVPNIPNKQFEEVTTKGKGKIEIMIPISKIFRKLIKLWKKK